MGRCSADMIVFEGYDLNIEGELMEDSTKGRFTLNSQILYPGFGNIWLIVTIGAVIYTYYFQNAQAAFFGGSFDVFEFSPEVLVESMFGIFVSVLFLSLPSLLIKFFSHAKVVTVLIKVVDKILFKGRIELLKRQLEALDEKDGRSSKLKERLHSRLDEIIREKKDLSDEFCNSADKAIEELGAIEAELTELEVERTQLREQAKSMLKLITLKVGIALSLLYWVILLSTFRPTNAMFISGDSRSFHWNTAFVVLSLYAWYIFKKSDQDINMVREVQKGNTVFIVGIVGAAIYLAPWFGVLEAHGAKAITAIIDGSPKAGVFVGKTFFNFTDGTAITPENIIIKLNDDSPYKKLSQ